MKKKQLTAEEAKSLFDSGWWKDKLDREIAEFQLYQDRLCLPFDEFYRAIEGALGRSVWTHEFADPDGLLAEFNGDEPTPENPAQHAIDSLAAMMLATGKDPEKQIVVLEVPPTGSD